MYLFRLKLGEKNKTIVGLWSARASFLTLPRQYILIFSNFHKYYRAASNIRGNLTDFQIECN